MGEDSKKLIEKEKWLKVLDCDIVVSEFELQFPYCVHFRIKDPGKCINLVISLAVS